jgi:hypothetical protein
VLNGAFKAPRSKWCDNALSRESTTAMHELGIATSILESVQSAARRHPGVRITKVCGKIGELAGVDVDALQFGFESLVKDTELEPSCWI